MAEKKSLKSLEVLMLEKFNELKDDIISIKESVIQNLLNENKRLNTEIQMLKERTIKVERDTYASIQYSRQNNIEVNGIPANISDENLQKTVLNVLNEIDVHVDPKFVVACHRLPSKSSTKSKTTIVRFVNRRICESAFTNRNKLKHFDRTAVGFDQNVNLYINDSLCPFIKRLAWKCRILKKEKKIVDTWSIKGKVFIRQEENKKGIAISHDQDLEELFPNFEYQ